MRTSIGAATTIVVVVVACLLSPTLARYHAPMIRGTPFLVKPTSLQTVLDIRGGAKRRPTKTASLSSTKAKTVTGKQKVGAAIAYFISPVDLIPEGLVGPAGYIDDVALAAYVLNSILNSVGPEVLEDHWAGDSRTQRSDCSGD